MLVAYPVSKGLYMYNLTLATLYIKENTGGYLVHVLYSGCGGFLFRCDTSLLFTLLFQLSDKLGLNHCLQRGKTEKPNYGKHFHVYCAGWCHIPHILLVEC